MGIIVCIKCEDSSSHWFQGAKNLVSHIPPSYVDDWGPVLLDCARQHGWRPDPARQTYHYDVCCTAVIMRHSRSPGTQERVQEQVSWKAAGFDTCKSKYERAASLALAVSMELAWHSNRVGHRANMSLDHGSVSDLANFTRIRDMADDMCGEMYLESPGASREIALESLPWGHGIRPPLT